MRKGLVFAGILAGVLSLVSACSQGHEKPVLTKDIFIQAAKKCGAKDAVFTENHAGNQLPTISFIEGISAGPNGPMRTSDCMAAEISSYRIEAMKIRFDTPASQKAS